MSVNLSSYSLGISRPRTLNTNDEDSIANPSRKVSWRQIDPRVWESFSEPKLYPTLIDSW